MIGLDEDEDENGNEEKRSQYHRILPLFIGLLLVDHDNRNQ